MQKDSNSNRSKLEKVLIATCVMMGSKTQEVIRCISLIGLSSDYSGSDSQCLH